MSLAKLRKKFLEKKLNNEVSMRLLQLIILFGVLSFSTQTLLASATESIQQSSNENKPLFIFFFKDDNDKTARLERIFDQTMRKLGAQVKFIKVQVNDPSEKSVIDKFNLKRSPMPFVVTLAPNGAITGGLPSFTEEQLVDSILSKGAASCLKALQERKLVLLCLQNSQTTNNSEASEGVNDFKADVRFSNSTEVVFIDPSNKTEQKFLQQLALNAPFSQATTVFISPPAEIIGKYQGAVKKELLISDLQKATSGACGASGCCPGGKCGSK